MPSHTLYWPVFLGDLVTVLISSHWTVVVRQHPSRFSSQHTGTGGGLYCNFPACIKEAAVHLSKTQVAGLLCCNTPPACMWHAVALVQVIKSSKHADRIPPARLRTGHGTGKCWVNWRLEKANQFPYDTFKLIGNCRQFWKTSSLSSWMEEGILPTKGQRLKFTIEKTE